MLLNAADIQERQLMERPDEANKTEFRRDAIYGGLMPVTLRT
jgi:hypothetical protein